jgi:nucleoside-triphosphatase
MGSSMNVILTGPRQVGKTSVCQAVVEQVRGLGRLPKGVLSSAIEDRAGSKVGFEASDAATGERWLLAHTGLDLDGPTIGPYRFDLAGLERAVGVLLLACDGADLVVVDEIGPLELVRGAGFAPVLDALPLRGPNHTLVVVRPSLLPEFRKRLGQDFIIYTVSEHNRDILPARITQEFWPDD